MSEEQISEYEPEQIAIPLDAGLIIKHKNGCPAVELRKLTTDDTLIKQLISAAFHNQPIVIQPTFYNRLQSLNSMVDKGIIYKDADGQFYYTF